MEKKNLKKIEDELEFLKQSHIAQEAQINLIEDEKKDIDASLDEEKLYKLESITLEAIQNLNEIIMMTVFEEYLIEFEDPVEKKLVFFFT